MRQIYGTVIVTFNYDVSTEEINEYFEQEGLIGTSVSGFIKRYAVEVPAGREDKYVSLFESCNLIESVNKFYLKGVQERPRLNKPNPNPKPKSKLR